MRIPIAILLFVAAAMVSIASPVPTAASVTKSQKGSFELTKSVRTNGCTLELRRYTKSNPNLQGYWAQELYIGDKRLLRIQHSVVDKEQWLGFEPVTGYATQQIDSNLNGKYEVFLVLSLQDQSLKDVLYVTENGWLRHATPEEFQARLQIAQRNREAIQNLDKVMSDALKKANPEFNR